MNSKVKIGIAAGVLALAVVVYVVVFLGGSSNSGTTPSSTTTPATQQTTTGAPVTGAPVTGALQGQPGAPVMPTATAGAPAEPVLTPPGPPPIKAVVKPIAGNLADPFKGGPKPAWLIPPPPRPPEYPIVALPPVPPTPVKAPYPQEGWTPETRNTESLGRLAGWIYNDNGQIVAIFEERSGKTRMFKVNEDIMLAGKEYRVKSITQNLLVLVDNETNTDLQFRLQSVNASKRASGAGTPAPPMPGWGTPRPATPQGGWPNAPASNPNAPFMGGTDRDTL